MNRVGYIFQKRKKQFAGFWHEYQWTFIGLLVLVAFLLGLSGFAEYFSMSGKSVSFWDNAYLSLQLFTLESGGVTGDLPWQLQIARFLAPAVLIYTAVKALLVIFRDQLNIFRLRRMRDHVIVCGLGEKGFHLAAGFVEQGTHVVGIELNDNNSKLELCHELGIIILTGNAAGTDNLKRAAVHRARYLFSVCGDDSVNAMVGSYARTLSSQRKQGRLTAYVHITDPEFTELLRSEELSMLYDKNFGMEFFNIYERGAHALLSAYPVLPLRPDVKGGTSQSIIVGLDLLGISLLRALEHIWKITCEDRSIKLKLVIVDHNIEEHWKSLIQNFPSLAKLTDVQMIDADTDFAKLEKLVSVDDQDAVHATVAYVCHDDERQSLEDALKIRRLLTGYDVQIVSCTNQKGGLGMQVSSGENGQSAAAKLASFGLIENTCTPDLLLGGLYEILARAIHNSYVQGERAKGQTAETNPAMLPWDKLTDTLKSSNRDQALHIGTKLQTVNCAVGPVKDWGKALFEFSPDQLELLAEMEHQRWVDEREADGWKYAEGKKNIEQKTSPHLVVWGKLEEAVKDYDRDAVRSIPSLVAQAGLEVYELS